MEVSLHRIIVRILCQVQYTVIWIGIPQYLLVHISWNKRIIILRCIDVVSIIKVIVRDRNQVDNNKQTHTGNEHHRLYLVCDKCPDKPCSNEYKYRAF